MLKTRNTRRNSGSKKVWVLLIMCLNTRALKLYLTAGYSTEDFLVAWSEFQADCGIPRRVHSDRGSQLVSAASGIEGPDYDWDKICSSSKGQIQWKFCPSGSQWRNGAIESFVKRFKQSLKLYEETGLSYAEMQSEFKKIAALLNSRPISARYGPRHHESDPDYLDAITPNMLLTGRSGIDLPARVYSDDVSPARRLAYKEELERSWWQRWKILCFDSCLPTKGWYEEHRGVKVGDIVLLSYLGKSLAGTYRLGLVEEIEVDKDGLVRTCIVGYRLIRSDLPKEDLRYYYKGNCRKKLRVPIQRLSLIVPVEEIGLPEFLKKKDTDIISLEADDEVEVKVKSGTCACMKRNFATSRSIRIMSRNMRQYLDAVMKFTVEEL